jgi:hypothetical protein
MPAFAGMTNNKKKWHPERSHEVTKSKDLLVHFTTLLHDGIDSQ